MQADSVDWIVGGWVGGTRGEQMDRLGVRTCTGKPESRKTRWRANRRVTQLCDSIVQQTLTYPKLKLQCAA